MMPRSLFRASFKSSKGVLAVFFLKACKIKILSVLMVKYINRYPPDGDLIFISQSFPSNYLNVQPFALNPFSWMPANIARITAWSILGCLSINSVTGLLSLEVRKKSTLIMQYYNHMVIISRRLLEYGSIFDRHGKNLK